MKTIEELQAELSGLQIVSEDEQRVELEQQIEEAKTLKSLKKLLDLTGESGLDGIVNVTSDLAEILEDEEVIKILDMKPKKDDNRNILGIRMISKLVPLVAKKHRQSLANILAALTGKPTEVILTYRLGLLIAMTTKVLMQDGNMINLFKR